MSLLARVIKFKTLSKQLTNNEFTRFLSLLSASCDREIILQLLCNPFMPGKTGTFKEEIVDRMVNITSNIIRSREVKDIEQRNISKIDEIPSALIGGIASYLYQRDYACFSRSNRALFVSCNTPNTLTTIDLTKTSHYNSIKLQYYPQMTDLEFNLPQFNQFHFPPNNGRAAGHRLETVVIHCENASNNDIQSFVSQKYLDFTNLRGVLLQNIRWPFSAFSQLLSPFKMVHRLDLWNVTITNHTIDIDTMNAMTLLPNLTKLCLFGVSPPAFMNGIFSQYCSNLTALSSNGNNLNLDSTNLAKLKKLTLYAPRSVEAIMDLLKTSKGLTEFVFCPYNYNTIATIDKECVISTVRKVLTDCANLKYLCIATKLGDCLEAICDCIASTVHKTNNRKREEFEIGIIIDCRGDLNASAADIVFNMSKIVNQLNASNTHDFMVHFECTYHRKFDVETMLGAINKYIQFLPSLKTMKSTENGFIIGNKDCQMQRHQFWKGHACKSYRFYK